MAEMFGFVTSVFREYMGNGLLLLYFVVATLFLAFKEKNKALKWLLISVTAADILVFFCPLTVSLIRDKMEEGMVYYRILWLLPTVVVSVYATIRIIDMFKQKWLRIALALIALVCVYIGGNPVYNSPLFTKSPNAYQIPEEVMELCEAVGIPGRTVRVLMPSELIIYVRQYSSYVEMPYGYDVQVEQWAMSNPIEREMSKDVTDTKIITDYAKETGSQYVVVRKDHELTAPVEKYGYDCFYISENYVVYLDLKANMFRPMEDDL